MRNRPTGYEGYYTLEEVASFPKAKYRLLEAHYSADDRLLMGDKENDPIESLPVTAKEEGPDGDVLHRGTIVGAGTRFPWPGPPTPAMVGLDEMSQALVEKEILRADGLNPVDFLPMVVDEAIIGESG